MFACDFVYLSGFLYGDDELSLLLYHVFRRSKSCCSTWMVRIPEFAIREALCFSGCAPHAFGEPLLVPLLLARLQISRILSDNISNGLRAQRVAPGLLRLGHGNMDGTGQAIRLRRLGQWTLLANLRTAKERLASIYRLDDLQQCNLLRGPRQSIRIKASRARRSRCPRPARGGSRTPE